MIIEYKQLKDLLGFPPNAHLRCVINHCQKYGIPYKRTARGIFTTEDALTQAMGPNATQNKKVDEVILL